MNFCPLMKILYPMKYYFHLVRQCWFILKKRSQKVLLSILGLLVCVSFSNRADALKVNYNFEAVLAHPERLVDSVIHIWGYAKMHKNGYALYYSESDYKYDTRENAIFVELKNKDSVEEFLKQKGVLQENGTCHAFSNSYTMKILDEKPVDGYAAVAENIWENKDTMDYASEEYNKVPYDLQNIPYNDNVEHISIYRLLGDPWTYDDKMVQVDVIYGGDGMIYGSNNRSCLLCDERNWEEVWASIESKLQRKLGTNTSIDQIMVATRKAGCDMCFTFRFYKVDTNEYAYGKTWPIYTTPYYLLFDVDIQNKDIEKIKTMINQVN